jgi:DUF971 family protein
MRAPDPVEIEVKQDSSLRISWDDAHESVYPPAYIRGWCPCAHCQGHGGRMAFVNNEAPRITAVEEVGNYALNIRFAGGHVTGIYTFEHLRALCPCETCQQAQGEKHPMRRTPAAAGGARPT